MGWSDVLNATIARKQRILEQGSRQAALGLTQAIIVKTPVDTGRARGNWNTNIGAPDTTTSDTKRANDALNDANSTASSLKLGDTFTIYNGLPYIQKLEYGYSQQAPQGMVRLSVMEFKQLLRVYFNVKSTG